MTAPHVRLHLFFATENDRAVILRQGPSKQCRMILWHRDTDTFKDGQWIKQRIYLDRCDLSPDGQNFIYFTLSGHWSDESEAAYSVVSRPPYFTALSLFPKGSTWGDGGRFVDNTRFLATGRKDLIGRSKGLVRRERKESTKTNPTGLYRRDGKPASVSDAQAARVSAPVAQSPGVALDRYDTMAGKLYRRNGNDFEMIRDFAEMTFERPRAPYDCREESLELEPSLWHTLESEPQR